jgi:hypothetical protein
MGLLSFDVWKTNEPITCIPFLEKGKMQHRFIFKIPFMKQKKMDWASWFPFFTKNPVEIEETTKPDENKESFLEWARRESKKQHEVHLEILKEEDVRNKKHHERAIEKGFYRLIEKVENCVRNPCCVKDLEIPVDTDQFSLHDANVIVRRLQTEKQLSVRIKSGHIHDMSWYSIYIINNWHPIALKSRKCQK